MVATLQKETIAKIDINIETQTVIEKVGCLENVNAEAIKRTNTVKSVTTWGIDTVVKRQKENIRKINTNIETQTAIERVG